MTCHEAAGRIPAYSCRAGSQAGNITELPEHSFQNSQDSCSIGKFLASESAAAVIHIYIYIYRERERHTYNNNGNNNDDNDNDNNNDDNNNNVYIYIYIYMYTCICIYIYTHNMALYTVIWYAVISCSIV